VDELEPRPLRPQQIAISERSDRRGMWTGRTANPTGQDWRWQADGDHAGGGGKAHKPYEFGVKVSVATTLKHSKGGQFVARVQALPGNPYDSHTLAEVIPAIEQLVGSTLERLHADAGYRGHNAPPEYKFKIYTSKHKRRVTAAIKREMRRRAAVEPVIGHLKEDHRMDRNYLAHRHGDFNNTILAAVGYNFRRLIRWLRILLCLIPTAFFPQSKLVPA
jgi:IS5 family transposase